MNLTDRQLRIVDIVKQNGPITGNDIAEQLGSPKSTIRTDLILLTHTGVLDAKPKVGYIVKSSVPDIPYTISEFQIKVGTIKSPAVYIKENASLHDAIIQIFLHDAGTIFVVDENEFLCGVVSRKDFLKSILGNVDINTVPVSVIMTRMPNIIVALEDETILEAAHKIMEHKIDSLPVVEKLHPQRYKITGRVSKTTLSRLFVSIGDHME